MSHHSKKEIYVGASFAVLATIIWAGNFIVARGVANKIPPISLAFYRWATASILILPIAYKKMKTEWYLVKKHLSYFLFTAAMGVALFNTFVYIAGHSTSAINMALIGTTSSPVFVIIIAALFFQEKIHLIRIAGLIFCIAGIIVLLSKGSWGTLLTFRFGTGDLWVLLGAFAFALYNIMVRRKPKEMSPVNFLNVLFCFGTLMLLPFFLIEKSVSTAVKWDGNLIAVVLYLGLGASVISFLLWNAAIQKIGAVRTSLFGNLIPIFASIEAIWLLGESLTYVHLVSGSLVLIGLIMANSKKANQPAAATANA